jgi:adenosylcobinamide-phosphate synthase
MAGVLGVELEKTGHYRLGAGLRAPAAADVDRAVRVMLGAAAMAVALAIIGVRFAT